VTRPDLLLVGEGFSPWTEKARWALDHHGMRYRYQEYSPLVSEPWLRIRAGRMSGRISVPYLLGPEVSVGDSFAIAALADRQGAGPPLVPSELSRDVEVWNARSERLMQAGRAQILERTEGDRAVQVESLPSGVPRVLRSTLASSVRIGTAYLRKKYAVAAVPDEALEVDLAAVRAALAATTERSPYLLGTFTLADVAIASALQAVRPHVRFPRGLGPAQRVAWERPELAARWEDLLTWRDDMIARHRGPGGSGWRPGEL